MFFYLNLYFLRGIKLGEVFKEIDAELKLDGVQPIPPDQEALDTILRATDDRVITVNMNQQLMANTFKQQEYMQEKEFYYEIRKNFGFKEKRIKEWKEYVQRVSKYSELIESKNKQMNAINDSRLPERDSVAYETTHNLEIPNLAVTVSFLPHDSFALLLFMQINLIYRNALIKTPWN